MSLLIVNTLPCNDPQALEAIDILGRFSEDYKIINAYEMNIKPCIGCNNCWLKTPGICSLKDGYEELLKGYLKYDETVFISGTALDFADHRLKNVIDRILPAATMYTCVVDGQFRHVPRYNKKFRFGLLYSGKADREYLNEWLDRVMINFMGESLGAFPIEQAKEMSLCI
ncbi:MAG: hypothetical protein ACI4J0_01550 [Huintestinicola sp.]|uniref:hypothetical protein n=1 Tax=Huintestinicola sp. TaxID=2981661 RepID=UPI003F0BE92D